MDFSNILKSNNKVTLKEANMRYVQYLGDGRHCLYDNETYTYEIWAANKNHASFGLKWRNTHLEFCSIVPKESIVNVKNLPKLAFYPKS